MSNEFNGRSTGSGSVIPGREGGEVGLGCGFPTEQTQSYTVIVGS
jgi:hypothetical protein